MSQPTHAEGYAAAQREIQEEHWTIETARSYLAAVAPFKDDPYLM